MKYTKVELTDYKGGEIYDIEGYENLEDLLNDSYEFFNMDNLTEESIKKSIFKHFGDIYGNSTHIFSYKNLEFHKLSKEKICSLINFKKLIKMLKDG